MKSKFLLCFVVLTLLSVGSCKKDSTTTPYAGYNYFPSHIGHFVIYDVDSIYKDAFTGHTDTATFQVKELVESVFADNEGRPTLRLERYKRLTPNDPWVIYKVWTANIDQKSLEKKEDNITYVKLVFPLKQGSTWDGNKKNDLGQKDYEITDLHLPASQNGLAFDSTLTVLQCDEWNFIDSCYEVERYAAGVGMYFKSQFNGEFNPNMNGFKHFLFYTEKIVSYSN